MKKLVTILSVAVLLFVFSVPAAAQEMECFVFDVDSYLDEYDFNTLNDEALRISSQYECGVYLAVFHDMAEYGYYSIEDFSEAVYKSFGLGFGDGENGILLVMSMEDRDYDLTAYGDYANSAFTDYGKEVLANNFLDNFRSNDWEGGFADYIAASGEILSLAEAGEPLDVVVDYPTDYPSMTAPRASVGERISNSLPVGLVIGVIISLIYCCILKGKMKSAIAATEADDYVCEHGVQMSAVMDQFTHSTVVRQRIQHDNGSRGFSGGGGGGTHVNSGGFSHHSGKF